MATTGVQQATLTVWKFPTATGAAEAVKTVKTLQQEGLINLLDAAIVSWPENKGKPKTQQLGGFAGVGALTGSFWGLLFGLIFFVPILGMAIGAGLGALAASMSDVGISDDFIRRVRSEVTRGTSALFAYTSGAVVDKVQAAMKPHNPTLLTSNLSAEQEKRLREAFAEEAG
ncbi:MAG: DUF1269 domain-containing protein [Chloroflexi bacterium]|nr:MAG: DUF1269 domain-containing protein [Chloroflexota bacterium]